MLLSIIITSYRNPQLLKLCIDSIKKNISLESSEFEMIVADSATENDTETMMREDYPLVKFIPAKENIGFVGTVENGYRASSGKYILILNGDILIKKNSVETLLEYIQRNPQVGLVGPKLLNFNETLQPSCFKFYSFFTILYRRTLLGKMKFARKHLDDFMMKDFDHNKPKEADWIMGSAIISSREKIEKVGLMDKQYKLYFEDVDWCRRFWEKEYKVVYYPNSEMYHYHGKGSSGKGVFKTLISKKLAWIHVFSALKYFWKYKGKPLPEHN